MNVKQLSTLSRCKTSDITDRQNFGLSSKLNGWQGSFSLIKFSRFKRGRNFGRLIVAEIFLARGNEKAQKLFGRMRQTTK